MPDPELKAAIIVFARLPVPGKAKTRLAASVGNEAAAEFYKLCAEQAFFSAYSCRSADAFVFCSAAAEEAAMQEWLQRNDTPMPVHAQQATADLGQRMLAALTAVATGAAATGAAAAGAAAAGAAAAAANSSPWGQGAVAPSLSHSTDSMQQPQLSGKVERTHIKQQQQQQEEGEEAGSHTGHHVALHFDAVLVIGTDIPDLTVDVLDQAVAALNTYEMVLGPAQDGGFYLMGFTTPSLLNPEVQAGRVFESVKWSTETVLQRTAAGAEKLGLNLAPSDTLPVLQDIDILQDLRAWFAQQATASVAVESGEPSQQQQQSAQQGQNSAATAGKNASKHSSSSSSDTSAKRQLQEGLQHKRAHLMTYVQSLLQRSASMQLNK